MKLTRTSPTPQIPIFTSSLNPHSLIKRPIAKRSSAPPTVKRQNARTHDQWHALDVHLVTVKIANAAIEPEDKGALSE